MFCFFVESSPDCVYFVFPPIVIYIGLHSATHLGGDWAEEVVSSAPTSLLRCECQEWMFAGNSSKFGPVNNKHIFKDIRRKVQTAADDDFGKSRARCFRAQSVIYRHKSESWLYFPLWPVSSPSFSSMGVELVNRANSQLSQFDSSIATVSNIGCNYLPIIYALWFSPCQCYSWAP